MSEAGSGRDAGKPLRVDDLLLAVARGIAEANGEAWEEVPENHGHWLARGGWFGGRHRGSKEPMKCTYVALAGGALEALAETGLNKDEFDALVNGGWDEP